MAEGETEKTEDFMKKTHTFTLAQILSITDGRLFCPIGDVYEILNFMTGDSIFTHVIPRAMKFAKPEILTQLPFVQSEPMLDALIHFGQVLEVAQTGGSDHVRHVVNQWIEAQSIRFGATHELTTAEDKWLSFDPIAEAVAMLGADKVAAVEVP